MADGNKVIWDGNTFSEHGNRTQLMVTLSPVTPSALSWSAEKTGCSPTSPDGARASTVIFTVLETAKANGLNPEKYIGHLLTVLPERFAHDPKPQIDDLLPWADGLSEICQA